MSKKILEIDIPKGYEIDEKESTFKKIVFTKKSNLPKTWEELGNVSGYCINTINSTTSSNSYVCTDSSKCIFPTKEEAEATIALAQLCQLRDRYNGEPLKDWILTQDNYYTIQLDYLSPDKLFDIYISKLSHILSFKTGKLAKDFLKNFEELITKAKCFL